MDLSKDQ